MIFFGNHLFLATQQNSFSHFPIHKITTDHGHENSVIMNILIITWHFNWFCWLMADLYTCCMKVKVAHYKIFFGPIISWQVQISGRNDENLLLTAVCNTVFIMAVGIGNCFCCMLFLLANNFLVITMLADVCLYKFYCWSG